MAVIDIETASMDDETSEIPSGYYKENSADDDFERKIQKTESALKLLNERFPVKKGLKAMLEGPRTVDSDTFYLSQSLQNEALETVDKIHENERLIAEAKAEKIRLNTLYEQLILWKDTDIPLNFSGTETTAAFIGTLNGEYDYETLLRNFAEKAPSVTVCGEVIFTLKNLSGIFLLCKREERSAAEAVLRELGFAYPPQLTNGLPSEKKKELKEKTSEIDKNIENILNNSKELSKKRELLESYADYCRARYEKSEVTATLALTENTVLIRGYVIESDLEYLKKVLERDFTVVIESERADEKMAPVKLKNNAFSTPAETITKMYSLPSHTDIDPTPLTGFFYYLLFGMMLSDAGYGLLMVIGTMSALKKFKLSSQMRNTVMLFLYCGISTFFWGLFFGSFFGDSIAVISETFFGKRIALPAVIDPMKGGAVQLLVLSLSIGFVQIIAALCAKFVTLYKNGDRVGAFFDAGLWITTLLGIGILAVGMFALPMLKTVGAVITVISLIGLILTGGRAHKNPILRLLIGVKSLYDITGYVSDLLSFSRLMALGLTTAAMGAVFNLLGTMGGKSIFGVLIMLIILPLGHAISFALNVLGAYVHTLRLQYVELFSKFYDGGGREFKPFSIKNKYVGINGIKEEKS